MQNHQVLFQVTALSMLVILKAQESDLKTISKKYRSWLRIGWLFYQNTYSDHFQSSHVLRERS